MAQLRAKQIRLPAAGHLLIGGTDGNGTTLARGADNTVLKVVAGGLAYSQVAAGETTFTPAGNIAATTVQGAVEELQSDLEASLLALETALEAADTALDTRLDTAEANITALETEVADVRLDLQTELDATQLGAGLETGGTYAAPTTSNYLGSATSLKDADSRLDAAIKVVADELDALGSGNLTALQSELDATQTAVGLNSDGTFNAAGVAGSNYVSGATTVMGAVLALDTALDTTDTTLEAAEEDILTIIQSAGLGNGGIFPTNYGNTILDSPLPVGGSNVTTLRTADLRLAQEIQIVQADLDAAEAAIAAEAVARDAADDLIQAELDATQASVGLNGDGSLPDYSSDNYILNADPITEDLADSHHVAIGKLDAVLGVISTELETTQGGAGLATTGQYQVHTGDSILGVVGSLPTSLHSADLLLANAIRDLQDSGQAGSDLSEAIALAVGLDPADPQNLVLTGTYIGGETTIVGGLEALDTQATTARSNITTLQGQVSTLQSDVANLVGLDALVFKGTMDSDITLTALEAIVATANDGDVYRITGDGQNPFAGGSFDVLPGDFVAFVGEVSGGPNTNSWVKFDNTDPTLEAAAGETALVVTGNTFDGFELAISKNDITSTSSAIGVTGGLNATFTDVAITFNPGNVNFTSLAQTGTPVNGNFLRWNGTSSTIEYVTAAQLGATVAAEEDFVETTTRANADYTLANLPVGDISVFINGVKLRKTGFTLVGSTVTLVDTVNGYGVENTDLVSVSYNRAA